MSDQPYDIMEEFASLIRSTFPVSAPHHPRFLQPDLEDTTLVLLATSLIDEFLKIVLIAGFRRDVVSKRRIEDVFGWNGALGTFSAKISLCALLGLTTTDVRHDLTILRKIRNDFAHSYNPLSLKDFPGCAALRLTSKMEIPEASDVRRRFKQSCLGVIGRLAFATMIKTAQQRFLSKNTEAVMEEYNAMLIESGITPPE